MERGMFFNFESNQRVGENQFYQDCILTVDVGNTPAGTSVGTIQVIGNSMTLDLNGERVRYKVEFMLQMEAVQMGGK